MGIHHCLGAALARIEGQIAIAAMLRRFPEIALTGDTLTHRPHPALRGLVSLPVALGV